MPDQIRKAMVLFVPLALLLVFAPLADSRMGGRVGGRKWGRDAVDLDVRKVTVTPIRAHVGDAIQVEMEWDLDGHITDTETNVATVRANGKRVASKKYPSGFGVRPGEVKRETFLWNTKGMAPGKYRIRGEVLLKYDPTPYDNYLEVKEPVLLIAEGESFPAGQEGGGEAVAENPY
jgi:hypothetical protein